MYVSITVAVRLLSCQRSEGLLCSVFRVGHIQQVRAFLATTTYKMQQTQPKSSNRLTFTNAKVGFRALITMQLIHLRFMHEAPSLRGSRVTGPGMETIGQTRRNLAASEMSVRVRRRLWLLSSRRTTWRVS